MLGDPSPLLENLRSRASLSPKPVTLVFGLESQREHGHFRSVT